MGKNSPTHDTKKLDNVEKINFMFMIVIKICGATGCFTVIALFPPTATDIMISITVQLVHML